MISVSSAIKKSSILTKLTAFNLKQKVVCKTKFCYKCKHSNTPNIWITLRVYFHVKILAQITQFKNIKVFSRISVSTEKREAKNVLQAKLNLIQAVETLQNNSKLEKFK